MTDSSPAEPALGDDDRSKIARKPSIVDVARLAHVHHSTASRALSGTGRVHAGTALRVRAAAAELGYIADPVARTLRSRDRRQRLIGVALDAVSMTGLTRNAQAFWFFLLFELTAQLSAANIGIVQVTLDALPSVEGMPVELLIVLSITDAPVLLPDSLASVPLIADRGLVRDQRYVGVIGHDHAAIAVAACDHLAAKGAKNVALLPLSDLDILSVAAARGYRQWCAHQGLEVRVLEPSGGPDQLRAAIRSAISGGVDGIYTVGGEIATVYQGIAAAGKRCPDDVLVVGVGNGIMEPLFQPPLTSVYLNAEGCARDLADLARRLMDGGPPESIEFQWELIERGSTDRRVTLTQ